jgi:hypothetical protein
MEKSREFGGFLSLPAVASIPAPAGLLTPPVGAASPVLRLAVLVLGALVVSLSAGLLVVFLRSLVVVYW